ncbi:hypothetical protein SAMN05428979_1485 [Stappia sp. ES.058]|nr:hypothetical protein SAMN05428979_1485 [Stappia sp. ES.058]
MMTNYENYHPYSPLTLWVAGILVFGVTLGTGVATIGSQADAMPRSEHRIALAERETPGGSCGGVIFRDADPACFAVRASPPPASAEARNTRDPGNPGEAAGS